MGQSSSNDQVINSNHQTFTVGIKHLNLHHPEFADLNQEFRNKFSANAWNQCLWTMNDAVTSYEHNGNYMSWKSAYNAINGLRTVTWIFCFIPFCVSVASFLITLFLLLIAIFLAVTGTGNSFYLWNATYNMLSTTFKYITVGCYLVTLIGIIILYFTRKSLEPLRKAYAQHMAEYISSNLITLSKVYGDACFQMKWIQVVNKLLDCNCGGDIELIALVEISVLSEKVEGIDDIVVMDAFNCNAESSQSRNYDELVAYRGCNKYNYCRVNTSEGGIADIQTDISIELTVNLEDDHFV